MVSALDLIPKPKKRRKGKKNRKLGRNYRWGEGFDGKSQTHTMTKYRARHGIGPGRRKDRRKQGLQGR